MLNFYIILNKKFPAKYKQTFILYIMNKLLYVTNKTI